MWDVKALAFIVLSGQSAAPALIAVLKAAKGSVGQP